MDNKFKNLTEGSMYKIIFALAIPLMINSLIQTIYNVVDGIWLGQVGANEFAATTFVSPILMVLISIGAGLSVAGTSIISQMIGMDRSEESSGYAYQLLLISTIIGILIAVFGYFLSPLFVSGMGAKDQLFVDSNTYLSISMLGFPAVLLTFAINAIMQAQGNTKPLTFLSLIAAIINMVLDPILIFETIPFTNLPGFNMGVSGAAYATIASQYANMILGFIVLKKISTIKVRFGVEKYEKKKMKNLLKIAFPSIVGQTSASFGFIILNIFITSYGTATLAAYGLVNRVTNILMQPTMAIGSAIPAIIGQNMGSRNFDRIRDCYKKAHIASFIISVLGCILMYVFSEQLILLFINAKDVAAVKPDAIEYMIYDLIIMPMMGSFSVFHGFFQGTGHTEYSMRMSMYRLWVIRLPMIYCFEKFLTLGSSGIWIAMLISNLLINIYGFYKYKTADWQSIKISD